MMSFPPIQENTDQNTVTCRPSADKFAKSFPPIQENTDQNTDWTQLCQHRNNRVIPTNPREHGSKLAAPISLPSIRSGHSHQSKRTRIKTSILFASLRSRSSSKVIPTNPREHGSKHLLRCFDTLGQGHSHQSKRTRIKTVRDAFFKHLFCYVIPTNPREHGSKHVIANMNHFIGNIGHSHQSKRTRIKT